MRKGLYLVEITEVFYPNLRQEWRNWLQTHHQKKPEVWVRTFRKATGKPSISYDDLVEECLCFGWIDGLVKKYDEESRVQRITPRRKKSFLSELNRQRVWKLQRLSLMTAAGLAPIEDQIGSPNDPLEIPAWVEEQLQEDPLVWENFRQFSHFYQRLKVGWIKECGPRRQEEAQKRLNYLIKMTRQGKQYGTIPLED
ncbi:MAG: YdeI/OmpD-associated family protein [Phaeodactylibacter sp.]|nr:YdeI/OmpD-associated family protein [Phaeodactylibacter sp.]MCB9303151.1 YdeI/OmpD-associated family protein [Lewinellaceae bacterium]